MMAIDTSAAGRFGEMSNYKRATAAAAVASLLVISPALAQIATSDTADDRQQGETALEPESGDASAESAFATQAPDAGNETVEDGYDPKQGRFDVLAGRLQEKYPESYAYASYDRNSDTGTIGWVGEPPTEAVTASETSSPIQFEHAQVAAEEAAQTAWEIDQSLLEKGADSTSVQYDRERGEYIALYTSASTLSANTPTQNMPVTYQRLDRLKGELQSVMIGGSKLRDDGSFECTAGNAVVRNGARAILTADHCNGLNQIKNQYADIRLAPFRSRAPSRWGDMEIHDLPQSQSVSDNIYDGVHPEDHFDPCCIGFINSSSRIYTYGQRTKEERTSLMQGFGVTYQGYGRLAQAEGCITAAGDSGAPVWNQNGRAVGIVQGCAPYGFMGFFVGTTFSQLRYVDDAFSGFEYYKD